MSINGNDEFDYFKMDDRMTDETKAYCQGVLKRMKPTDAVKVPVALVRAANIETHKKHNESLTWEKIRTEDFLIKNSKDGHQIPVRKYIPISPEAQQRQEKGPIVNIFYHGGGWVYGDILTSHYCLASLCSVTQTIWLSVEYRLAPEHTLDQIISDCRSVMEWVLTQKKQSNSIEFNKARLGVSGDSAGGHLATLMSHDYRTELSHQILVYPAVDLVEQYDSHKEFAADRFLIVPAFLDFFRQQLHMSEEELRASSTLFFDDFSRMPPTLIVSAELDPLLGQGEAYAAKMRQNKCQVDLKIVKGTVHSFFHNGAIVPQAFNESVKHIVGFLKEL